MDIILQPGDVFCTENPQGLGTLIKIAEEFRNESGTAIYTHSGIIIDSKGTTFEALWHIAEQNIFEAYKGQKVLIARWSGMMPDAFQKGFDSVKDELGRTYPYYRLLMYLIGMEKWIHFKTPVCSELTEKFLENAGAMMIAGTNWWGITPDELATEWRISKYFNVIYEGISGG